MTEQVYWIWFSRLQHLRFRTRRALLERFGGAKKIWEAIPDRLASIGTLLPEERRELLGRDLSSAERILRRCREERIRVLCYDEAAFPERLRVIPDPPCVLYILGTLPDVDTEPVVAVVGTRRCTNYGVKMAKRIAAEIAESGAIVTTGLAAGIDSAAAEGCLDAGGRVLGVLGVAIDQVYPRSNAALYARVMKSGALISEYPPGERVSKNSFPIRNRIIAALSLCVTVVEAPERSGALITAHRALDYGKDVFAVPSNADSIAGRGSNQLLREGAGLAESGWDILSEYEAVYPDRISRRESTQNGDAGAVNEKPEGASDTLRAQLAALSGNQLKIIGVMDRGDMHVDDIIDMSGLPASVVLSELTMLQIKGFVRQDQGKRFTLNINK